MRRNQHKEESLESKEGSALGPYKRVCPICNKVVERGMTKNAHILLEHFSVFASCKLCQGLKDAAESKTKHVPLEKFYNHLISEHDTVEVKCPFCRPIQGRYAPEMDQRSLSQHILEKHSQSLMCRCNVCHVETEEKQSSDEKLIKVVSLKSHISHRHTVENQKQVSCEQCGTFVAACNLQKHIKNMHMEKVHNDNNLCDLCGKHFVHLKQHKLSVHKSKDSWSFKCGTCGKRFAKRYNLEVHSRLHTGERPYICDVCGKGFCQKVELKLHKKNHHDAEKKRQRKNAKKKVIITLDDSVPSDSKGSSSNSNGNHVEDSAQPSQTVIVKKRAMPLAQFGKGVSKPLPRHRTILIPETSVKRPIPNAAVTETVRKKVIPPKTINASNKDGSTPEAS